MFVDHNVMFSGDGSAWYPFKTLCEALIKANRNETIFVTPIMTNDADSPIIMDKNGTHIWPWSQMKWQLQKFIV